MAAVDIERVVSPGGIEAWLVEDPTAPLISMAFAFHGGAALDPVGKEGLAEMTSGLLDEGAGDLDSEAFQRRIADLALDFGFDAGLDSFGGSLRTLTENREAAFDLVGAALTVPRFDAAARSEEHTSELQSLMRISYAVFCLKKKRQTIKNIL